MVIAICDDEINMLQHIKEECTLILQDKKEAHSFLTFQKGEDLITALEESEEIHILLLDIDMPGISGLEAAKNLRKKYEDVILIFVSAYEQYVFDSFEYHPFRFIRKNRLKQELPVALRAAESLYQKNRKRYIVIKCDEGDVRIEQSEITHVEVLMRRLYIYLQDGTVLHTWKTIKEFLKEMNGSNFVKIHSGCAVNLKYVSRYAGNEITLDNGVRLIASRAGMKTFKEELSRYWSR